LGKIAEDLVEADLLANVAVRKRRSREAKNIFELLICRLLRFTNEKEKQKIWSINNRRTIFLVLFY